MAEEKQEIKQVVEKTSKGVKKRTKIVRNQKEVQKAIQATRLKPTELEPYPPQKTKK